MGIGLVSVKTEVEGQDWVNTYGISVNGEFTGSLDEDDLTVLTQGVDFTDPAISDPDNPAYLGAQSPLVALLGFHRRMTYTPAVITGLYVTDGKRNGGASVGDTNYFSANLNLAALKDVGGNGQTRVPLSLAWLVNRNPAGFGVKPGRLYLRYALTDEQVRAGTRDGVTWATVQASIDAGAYLATTLNNTGMIDWLGGTGSPTPGPLEIGLPRYVAAGGAGGLAAGELFAITKLASYSSHDPVSRQLTRGRRRRTSIPTPG